MMPVATPARIHRTPTVVVIVNGVPPCLSTQNEKDAGTSIVLVASCSANRPSAARITPRMRAARRGASHGLAVLVGDVLGDRGARRGHAALPSGPGRQVRRRRWGCGRRCRWALGCLLAVRPPDRPDEPRGGDEHDHQRLDEEQQVERDAGLHLHQAAAGAQRAEQERRGDDAGRPVAGEQGEGDRVEAVAGADVVGHLGDRARGPPSTPPSPASPPESDIARMIEPLALMPAYFAAVRLKPAARSSKPLVVLNRNHDTTTAMTSATTKP